MSKELEAFVAGQDHFELVSIADKTKVRRRRVSIERCSALLSQPGAAGHQVRCTLTGHEMLPELEICRLYLGGKAYKRALRRRGAPPAAARAQPPRSCADQRRRLRRAELEAFDFAQYEPHIVPHRTDPFLLYCACAAPPLPPRRPSAAERRCPAGGRR